MSKERQYAKSNDTLEPLALLAISRKTTQAVVPSSIQNTNEIRLWFRRGTASQKTGRFAFSFSGRGSHFSLPKLRSGRYPLASDHFCHCLPSATDARAFKYNGLRWWSSNLYQSADKHLTYLGNFREPAPCRNCLSQIAFSHFSTQMPKHGTPIASYLAGRLRASRGFVTSRRSVNAFTAIDRILRQAF